MLIIAKPPPQRLIDHIAAFGGNWSLDIAVCPCPAYTDPVPSLCLTQGDRDILFHCFVSCDPADVMREIAITIPGRKHAFSDEPFRLSAQLR